MFKINRFFPIRGGVMLLTSTQVFSAAPTAELKVIGKIEVPACSLTIDGNGAYDFGSISPTMVKPGTELTELPSHEKTLRVACTGRTYLTYQVTDNRADSVSAIDPAHFGLGRINETGKLGYYRVGMSQATVDNQASKVFSTNTTALLHNARSAWVRGLDYTMGWSNDTALQAGQNFSVLLKAVPFLAGETTMNGPIDDIINLEGSLTLNFAFGL